MKIEKETKVVILQNGNAVMATQYVNGKKVNASIARCCPEDAFDFAFGAKLALERLLDCMGSAPETAFDWDKFISGDVWVQTNSSNTGLRRASFDRSNRRSSDKVECIS